MTEKLFTVDEDRQREFKTQDDVFHPFMGVSVNDFRNWGDDLMLKADDEYISRRTFNPSELHDGQIVQLIIDRMPKKYTYMVTIAERNNITEYTFRPCYSRSKRAYIFEEEVTKKYMHGQEEIKSIQIFCVSDAYILDQWGHPELVVNSQI